jgi:hypothetical protein
MPNNKPRRKASPQAEEYQSKEPGTYEVPENMVPINDQRYLKKDKVGSKKAVRGPGSPVTTIGLGGLEVITQTPINYNGNTNV